MKQQTQANKIEWREVELGELVSKEVNYPIGDGDHGQIKPSMYQNHGIPYIRVGDLVADKICLDKIVYISEKVHKDNLKSELLPGDVLIAKTGATIGKVAIIPKSIQKANTTSSVGKITPDKNKILPEYLLYFIKTKEFIKQMWLVSIKSAQPGFNIINLKKFRIPLPFSNGKPDLKEQERIVYILEKAEMLKEKGKSSETLLNKYLESTFYEMFYNRGLEEVELGDICEINPKKSELEKVDRESNISFLEMANVGEKGEIFNEEIRKLKEVIKSFTYFKRNDVLFAKITPCMENGKGTIAKISKEIGFGSTEFHILRPIKNKSTPEWIYYLLSLKSIRKSAEKNMTGSAGQKRVPKYFLQTLKVPFPPIHLQQKFVKIVEQVKKMKENVKKTKQNSEELFNSLMQKAFRGEL